jgi:hypothetical protein
MPSDWEKLVGLKVVGEELKPRALIQRSSGRDPPIRSDTLLGCSRQEPILFVKAAWLGRLDIHRDGIGLEHVVVTFD